MKATLLQIVNDVLPGCVSSWNENTLSIQHANLIGEARLEDRGDHVFINQIYFVTNQQGTGLGTKLLNEVVSACKTYGYNRIECQPTSGGQLHGERFCRKHGFKVKQNSSIWVKYV